MLRRERSKWSLSANIGACPSSSFLWILTSYEWDRETRRRIRAPILSPSLHDPPPNLPLTLTCSGAREELPGVCPRTSFPLFFYIFMFFSSHTPVKGPEHGISKAIFFQDKLSSTRELHLGSQVSLCSFPTCTVTSVSSSSWCCRWQSWRSALCAVQVRG